VIGELLACLQDCNWPVAHTSGSARVPRALVDPFGQVFDDYSSDEFELALRAPDPLWMPSADLWPDDGVTRIEERLLAVVVRREPGVQPLETATIIPPIVADVCATHWPPRGSPAPTPARPQGCRLLLATVD
jgi:hypothetical protein